MSTKSPQHKPAAKIIAVGAAIVVGFFLLKPSAALVSALCDAGYCDPKSRLLTLVWLAAHLTASAAIGYAVWANLRSR